MKDSILIIQPFRKPKFRDIIVKNYPYWEVINTNPLQLAAVLEQGGYNVDFLNTQNIFKSFDSTEISKLHKLLSNYTPKVLIIHTDYYMANSSTASFFSIKLISKYYKSVNKNIKIILVGRNGLALGSKVFNIDSNIDIVVKGECEEFICQLIKGIDDENISNIPNIFYKNKDEVIENSGVGQIKDIDSLPTVAFHLLKENVKIIEKETGMLMKEVPISIRTSFGCPMNCNFCGGISNWNDYHFKSKEVIEKEIKYFNEVFGEKGQIYFLTDEIFVYNYNHVSDMVSVFKKNNVRLKGLFAHTRFFNEDAAKKINEITDCVVFGAENCCDEILRTSNKNQKFQDILNAIDIAKNNNLHVSLEWMVGLPGENIKTAIKNLNTIFNLLVKNKVDDINTYVFCAHPNTKFYNECKNYKININGSFDDMLEEGGYPTSSLDSLNTNQIYIYYLLSQLIIKEALYLRGVISSDYIPDKPNMENFEELFNKIKLNK